uniref:GDNF/GAS1 domain-containing protein n=1 Tax=Sphenodon punctatus TaxID=8508 RepID=A0A8D0G731_SPHPU
MWLPLLLGLLLSRTGGLLALPSVRPTDCIAEKKRCLADPVCSATYRTLENCSLAKHPLQSLGHGTRAGCLNAELVLRNSPLQQCKCHRHMRRQEHCLHVYWTVHPSLTTGLFNLETSPYEDPAYEEPLRTDYKKLAAQVSGSRLIEDSTNACLSVTHICSMNKKCARLRTNYASTCSKEAGDVCDQHKCHQELRQFFEKLHTNITRSLLFCPCQDEVCGERRRKTIVPECSFQESTKR